jgi:hypothetical protein
MTWLIVLPVVALLVLALVMFRFREARSMTDREALAQTAIELHRIDRQFGVAHLKTEQRQDMTRLRRQIGDVLDERK